MYKLVPFGNNIVVEPIKPKDVKQYTGKVLADVETGGVDVLQFGKVVEASTLDGAKFSPGDIILYEKLAAHKTNMGDPRLVLVDVDHVQGRII